MLDQDFTKTLMWGGRAWIALPSGAHRLLVLVDICMATLLLLLGCEDVLCFSFLLPILLLNKTKQWPSKTHPDTH